jgi:hypothetical protein
MCATFAVTRDRFGRSHGLPGRFGAYWVRARARRSRCSVALMHGGRSGYPTTPSLDPSPWGRAAPLAPGRRDRDALPTRGRCRRPYDDRHDRRRGCRNAVLEELLWRGVYIELWPDDPWLGWVWPALVFRCVASRAPDHPSILDGVDHLCDLGHAAGALVGWVACARSRCAMSASRTRSRDRLRHPQRGVLPGWVTVGGDWRSARRRAHGDWRNGVSSLKSGGRSSQGLGPARRCSCRRVLPHRTPSHGPDVGACRHDSGSWLEHGCDP